MSNHPHTSSLALFKINQFIRPYGKTPTRFETASTPKRLVLKGTGFATSNKVAAAIREGVTAELVNALMAALGNCFERLSDEDVHILAEFYTAAQSAATMMADAVVEPEGPNVLVE